MTPRDVLKHYDNSYEKAGASLGFTVTCLRNWVKSKRVPEKSQWVIQAKTEGALKASSK